MFETQPKRLEKIEVPVTGQEKAAIKKAFEAHPTITTMAGYVRWCVSKQIGNGKR